MPIPYIPKHNPYSGEGFGKTYAQLCKEDVAKFKEDPSRGTDPNEFKKESWDGLRPPVSHKKAPRT